MGIRVKGISGYVANLRAADQAAQREIREAVQENASRQLAETQAECPVDTGYMRSQTKAEFSEQGLRFSVGYDEADFPGAFYPQYVIYGTSRMAPNDFLFRVHERLAAENTQRVGNALRRSLARYA